MRTPVLFCSLAASLLLVATSAHALFKVVGPDGRVTYSDRAPSPSDGKVTPVDSATGRASDPTLPYALRLVATRFPVTLYTASDCGEACALGRALLARRGVPYNERTAETEEDRQAWQRLVGGPEAPVLKVGGQSLRGYTQVAWDETLDVAGYPRQSVLPANYQPTPPTPLVERRPPPTREAPQPPTTLPVDPVANPTGIRF